MSCERIYLYHNGLVGNAAHTPLREVGIIHGLFLVLVVASFLQLGSVLALHGVSVATQGHSQVLAFLLHSELVTLLGPCHLLLSLRLAV